MTTNPNSIPVNQAPALAATAAAPVTAAAPATAMAVAAPAAGKLRRWLAPVLPLLEALVIEGGALLVSMLIFALFLLIAARQNPLHVYANMWKGSFGNPFSRTNSLSKAAPLMLTALCTALPARLGMVIIGNEGALLLGGLAGVATAVLLGTHMPVVTIPLMLLAAGLAGGAWIALAGMLRQYRGVNETISSLLLYYVALGLFQFMTEDLLRDPASLNKPSTYPIGDANMIGLIPGVGVHWGLLVGVVACVVMWVLMDRTTFGFSVRLIGGNDRAARLQGLPISRIAVTTCMLAGAFAGIAGIIEVGVAEGSANSSLNAGYGFAGILVAFVARQNPLAIIPVAVLFGGIQASGGLIQRRHGLPDATTQVFTGILFVVVLASEMFFGRIKLFQQKETAT